MTNAALEATASSNSNQFLSTLSWFRYIHNIRTCNIPSSENAILAFCLKTVKETMRLHLMAVERHLNNVFAFSKSPNRRSQIEHNMWGNWLAQIPLWRWRCLTCPNTTERIQKKIALNMHYLFAYYWERNETIDQRNQYSTLHNTSPNIVNTAAKQLFQQYVTTQVQLDRNAK